MTTNISEVFNSVLKRARSLPVTALVQSTFFRLNSYFVVKRELSATRLTSDEQFTPYVDAHIHGRVVKAGSMKIVHQYVEDGCTYSSIRDPHRILWYIPVGLHHDRLAIYHLSR